MRFDFDRLEANKCVDKPNECPILGAEQIRARTREEDEEETEEETRVVASEKTRAAILERVVWKVFIQRG